MLKPKKFDWKDSNMALFGSDVDHQVKKESAEIEPAWKDCGKLMGLKIWRIVKFKVTAWPKDQYGEFYTGDSYIILNTYKNADSDALAYDVHFWIGSKSTQDEYGAAAYKTVELDTFLDDVPIQHREVQGHESALFKSYFETINTMEGGADTGFRRVLPENYPTRLMHFNGAKKHITIKEVPCSPQRLKSDDVYILDQGLQLYQWNGSGANKDEKWKAATYVNSLMDQRGGKCKKEVLDEDSTSSRHPFMLALTAEDEEDDDEPDCTDVKALYKISDESGKIQFTPVELTDGKVTREDFISEDVYVLDNGDHCYVWVGSGASVQERRNALSYAHEHLKTTDHALIPICVVGEDQHCNEFESAIAA